MIFLNCEAVVAKSFWDYEAFIYEDYRLEIIDPWYWFSLSLLSAYEFQSTEGCVANAYSGKAYYFYCSNSGLKQIYFLCVLAVWGGKGAFGGRLTGRVAFIFLILYF